MILDIGIIIIIALSAFSGYKKGLTTILVRLIGFILALILAFSFKGALANFVVENTEIENSINTVVSSGIENAINANKGVQSEENAFYANIVKNMPINETVDQLKLNVTNFILETAAFIVIFFAVTLCAYILQMMLNLVFDLPILKSINSIGGMGLAVLLSIFKIWILLAIVSILLPTFAGLRSLIDSSILTKILFDTNIIIKILSAGINV